MAEQIFPLTQVKEYPPIEVGPLGKDGCRFCELVKGMKEQHRDCNKSLKLRGRRPKRNKFGAALVDRTFGGRVIYPCDGRHRFRLNFCPECGQCLRKWGS